MSKGSPEPRTIPVDILPHKSASPPPFAGLRTFYHPASGVVILGIDLLVFGPEIVSDFLLTPIMCAVAFCTTFPLVWVIQAKWAKDSASSAFGKAFLGAFFAGLPFSIAGTFLGTAVLVLSGLPRHPAEAFRKLIPKQEPK